eukprot:CAMPEP_0201481544 /NCGR_PEP_ID=MMETSP0151_2-20130828/5822_1 /ASSEMBLY_ACC=CAM_ASM_000257 /TAXON_ID=200890 /ORGANISM="Paramoeba atlantica, Strain 621/1 / CCAP 1560/9" /LENGTH=116 /DNA_ID=CAMNT_0047863805 /DNA_START=771 /DNA_END=1118 /DNA_ORIENTATION=-
MKTNQGAEPNSSIQQILQKSEETCVNSRGEKGEMGTNCFRGGGGGTFSFGGRVLADEEESEDEEGEEEGEAGGGVGGGKDDSGEDVLDGREVEEEKEEKKEKEKEEELVAAEIRAA